MRINGAVEPHNGALVTINERDDEGGGKVFNQFLKTNVSNIKLDLFEVNNKAVKLTNTINSVQQKPQQKQLEQNLKLTKEQQQKITKLQQNSLITPNGNNNKNKKRNNNNNTNNNNNNKNNNSTCRKQEEQKTKEKIKASQSISLIDEIRYKKLKENPETSLRIENIKRIKLTKKAATIKTPKTTSIKGGKSGGLGMYISILVTGFATITAEIMRVLHVQKSLRNAQSSGGVGGGGDGGNGNVENIGTHCQQRCAASSLARCLGTLAFFVLLLLPCGVVYGDDGDNFFAVNSFSMGPDTTTPQFDYASRGKKKFGDKCENTLECGFPGSQCDPKQKTCQCTEDLLATNHIDKCGKLAAVNESCWFNEQCESKYFQTECRDGKCVCRFEMTPVWNKDGSVECKGRQEKRGTETYVDPAMIGVLVGMALMFIIICVVLRLFSQARWRENRTIFNTPNPRLMNVSLLRDSKLIHGQERRGSRMSMRGPSRQPSMASLRPHSPNPSLGKTGSHSNSHGSGSNASATSLRSTRSNSVAPGHVNNTGGGHHERHGSAYYQHQHSQHNKDEHNITNITTNPVAESVTVEIMTPDK